jgi:hypothetical protein
MALPLRGGEQSETTGPERCLQLKVFIRGDSEVCQEATKFAEDLSKRRGGICVEVRDVAEDSEALKEYWGVMRRFRVDKPVLPAFYACNQLKAGFASADKSRPDVAALFTIHAYVRMTCPHCRDARRFLSELARRWPGIRVVFHDVERESGAMQRMTELARRHGTTVTSLPGIYACGRFIAGYQSDATTGRQIEDLLRRASTTKLQEEPRESKADAPNNAATPTTSQNSWLSGPLSPTIFWAVVDESQDSGDSVPLLPDVGTATDTSPILPPVGAGDASEQTYAPPAEAPEGIEVPWFGLLRVRDWGLPAFTLLIGLVDGFNPCAMWVLVFLLSVLVNVKDRRKIAAIAGTFVCVSGAAYFAFMAAWLNVFMFVGIARPLQIVLGVLAVLIGVINVKDFFAFKRGVTLSIPESAKPGIYARVRRIVSAEYISVAVWLSVALAIAVNVVELLCTAGLPALYTQILTLQQLPAWRNYAYLGLYNVAYIFDDSLMVAAFVVTLSHRKMREAEGRWLKLVSGAVVLALGLTMLFRPSWLQWNLSRL